MGIAKFKNNAVSTLAAQLLVGGATMTVATGEGNLFPVVTAGSGDWFKVTLVDSSGNREIVKVTLRETDSDVLTITRAQEGTVARQFEIGDIVSHRITASELDTFSEAISGIRNVNSYGGLEAAVTAIGATETSVVVTDTQTLTGDLVIPTTLSVYAARGAEFDGAHTLTFQGPFKPAGRFRVFSNSITVRFGLLSTVERYLEWWGGVNDDSTDNYAAFVAADESCHDTYGGRIQLGTGIYRTSDTWTVTNAYTTIYGNQRGGTEIKATTTDKPIINLTLVGQEVQNIKLTRSVVAVAGGNGINVDTDLNYIRLENLWIRDQYNGISAGSSSTMSFMKNVISEKNVNHGVRITNDTGSASEPIQWNMIDVLSQHNDGSGFYVYTTDHATVLGVISGEWQGCTSVRNTGYGFYFKGTVGTPLHDIRISQCFSSGDNIHGFFFTTYGRNHYMSHCFAENTGRLTTGRTLATAATNTGVGIYTDNTNEDILMVAVKTCETSDSGLWLDCEHGTLVGAEVRNGGMAENAGQQNGLLLAPNGNTTVVGGTFRNRVGGVKQLYGINIQNTENTIIGANCTNNTTAPITYTAPATVANTTVLGCLPTTIDSSVPGNFNIRGVGYFGGTPQTLTGAGAVSLTTATTWVVTTGGNALTLADGAEGQMKFIVMKTDVGAGTLTPDNLGNGATITFDDVGDSAFLYFTNSAWHFMGGTATLA